MIGTHFEIRLQYGSFTNALIEPANVITMTNRIIAGSIPGSIFCHNGSCHQQNKPSYQKRFSELLEKRHTVPPYLWFSAQVEQVIRSLYFLFCGENARGRKKLPKKVHPLFFPAHKNDFLQSAANNITKSQKQSQSGDLSRFWLELLRFLKQLEERINQEHGSVGFVIQYV